MKKVHQADVAIATITAKKVKSSKDLLSFDNPIVYKVNREGRRPTGVVLNALPEICENPTGDTLLGVIETLKTSFSHRKKVVFNVPEQLVAVFKEHFPYHFIMKRELAPSALK